MSISYQILGKPSGDNALLVNIDSGQEIRHLLFDCGESCLSTVPPRIIQKIDHLFFSHLHMDHIGGFDTFFRCNYNRNYKQNHIWGPPQTAKILHHRFQGFLWNLHESMRASWKVTDIYPEQHQTYRFELQEAFSVMHNLQTIDYRDIIHETDSYTIAATTLDHQTPSLAYLIREKPRFNIDISKMDLLELVPGPWLKQLKEYKEGQMIMPGSDRSYSFDELRKILLTETTGDSIAYVTDFFPDKPTINRLSSFLKGCQTIVCEAHYRNSDIELAQKNFHSTAILSASIALQANAKRLILFHLSDRYHYGQYREMLEEAREVFEKTSFPEEWN